MATSSTAPRPAREIDPSGNNSGTISYLSSQVKNTVKDLVSVLKGYCQGAETGGDPALIQNAPEPKNAPEYWKDWRWQGEPVDIKVFHAGEFEEYRIVRPLR
jgi:hypothetical protein